MLCHAHHPGGGGDRDTTAVEQIIVIKINKNHHSVKENETKREKITYMAQERQCLSGLSCQYGEGWSPIPPQHCLCCCCSHFSGGQTRHLGHSGGDGQNGGGGGGGRHILTCPCVVVCPSICGGASGGHCDCGVCGGGRSSSSWR